MTISATCGVGSRIPHHSLEGEFRLRALAQIHQQVTDARRDLRGQAGQRLPALERGQRVFGSPRLETRLGVAIAEFGVAGRERDGPFEHRAGCLEVESIDMGQSYVVVEVGRVGPQRRCTREGGQRSIETLGTRDGPCRD